jgi:predicted metal-dependent peptidase
LENYDTLDILRLARAYSAEKLPWFSPALYTARIILTKKVPVAAIDQHMNVYFNPEAITKMAQVTPNKLDLLAELGYLWIHEISHVLRDHSERSKERKANHELWNIAADLEINDSKWPDTAMPKAFMGIVPLDFKQPEGKLTEWYYSALFEKADENKEKAQQLAKNGKNIADEGSGVHGHSREWEEADGLAHDATDPNSSQQILHPIDLEIMRRDVANKMVESRKYIGTFPGSWEVWVDKILKSRIDWRKKLRHRMSVAIATGMGARVDYTFSKLNRRQSVYFPVITPAFSGDMSARVACVVDTSGSMGGDELGRAVGEVCKVLEDFKVPVTVIPCDSKAYEPILLRKPSDYFKVQKLKGGGGTDMIAGIRAALALRPAPDSILVLTDGHTPYPTAPFKTPVIFGILKGNYEDKTPEPGMPPWGADAVVAIVV